MPDSERKQLDDDIKRTLAASRALMAVVARTLADVLEQVTLPQFRVLVVLCAKGPLRSGALAERLGVHSRPSLGLPTGWSPRAWSGASRASRAAGRCSSI